MNSQIKTPPRVYIQHLASNYPVLVREGLTQVGFFEHVPPGSKVFLKPNLTFPTYQPGVMTSYECLKAVTELLTGQGYKVIIGEADSGGYNRFSMDEVFDKMGINDLARQTGAQVVNLSFTKPEIVALRAGWRHLKIPMP